MQKELVTLADTATAGKGLTQVQTTTHHTHKRRKSDTAADHPHIIVLEKLLDGSVVFIFWQSSLKLNKTNAFLT